MKKRYPLPLLLLAALLMLAACGDEPTPVAGDGAAFPVVTVQYGMAPVKTPTPVSTPTAVAARPTATWVPLPSPSPTVDDGTPTAAGVPRIGVAEAKARADAGEAVFVDVRGEANYARLRIAGALWLSSRDMAAGVAELPADKLLIFYCA